MGVVVDVLVLLADSAAYLQGGTIIEPYASCGSEYALEGASEERMALAPEEFFRLPLDEYTQDYAESTDEEGFEHLTIPYMRIGLTGFWRIHSDPWVEIY